MERTKRFLLSFLALMLCTIMYAQTEITGTVVDDFGDGLPGATVKEKENATNGTVTDMDGHFKIKVKSGAMLVISYIGFETQEVAAQDGMKVTMGEAASELNELVVTGYSVQRKADLTGAVSGEQPDEGPAGSCTRHEHQRRW